MKTVSWYVFVFRRKSRMLHVSLCCGGGINASQGTILLSFDCSQTNLICWETIIFPFAWGMISVRVFQGRSVLFKVISSLSDSTTVSCSAWTLSDIRDKCGQTVTIPTEQPLSCAFSRNKTHCWFWIEQNVSKNWFLEVAQPSERAHRKHLAGLRTICCQLTKPTDLVFLCQIDLRRERLPQNLSSISRQKNTNTYTCQSVCEKHGRETDDPPVFRALYVNNRTNWVFFVDLIVIRKYSCVQK